METCHVCWKQKKFTQRNTTTIVLVSTMGLFSPIVNAACTPGNMGDCPVIQNDDEVGNYEVDYGGLCSADCQLKESTNFGGSWQTVASGNAEGNNLPPYVATNKPDGTYFYKTRDLEFDEEEQEGVVTYSEVSEITVGPVNDPPTLLDQLDYSYETRLGDINADGLQDIFLNRTTVTPPNNGTIKSVILKQVVIGQEKSFDIFFPSQAQATQASSWQSIPLHLVPFDLNIDGFVDYAIKGIATYISGMDDQIVYSPAVAFTDTARAIKAMDPELMSFVNDMISYYRDRDFFTNNELTITSGGFYRVVPSCSIWFHFFQDRFLFGCEPDLVFVPATSRTIFPGVSDGAVGVWESMLDAEAGLGPWETVVDWFEMQLGVNILYPHFCHIVFGSTDDPDCISVALARVWVALHSLAETEESATGRDPNVVYITKRAIFFSTFNFEQHTALEFRSGLPNIAPIIISAHNFNGFSPFGTLIAQLNWEDDAPIHMTTAGSVASTTTNALYFLELLAGETNYESQNCLRYLAQPSAASPNFPAYNSNSFTAGLIAATNGFPGINMDIFTGGETPVPSAWFTNSPPPCP